MEKLSPERAQELARELWEEGWPRFVGHAREQMESRSISDRDTDNAMMGGTITREPEWDEHHKEWRYRVDGFDIDGEKLGVAIAFEQSPRLVIVTVF